MKIQSLNSKAFFVLPFFILFLFLAAGCSPDLRRQLTEEDILTVFRAHTGDLIRPDDEVAVIFQDDVPINRKNGTLDGIFEFSPAVAGKAGWKDDKTLVFKPSQSFAGGTEYKVKLKTDLVLKQYKGNFEFAFKTMPAEIESFVFEPVASGNSDSSAMKLKGSLSLTDRSFSPALAEALTLTVDGEKTDFSCTIAENGVLFLESIPVPRLGTQRNYRLVLDYDKKGIRITQELSGAIPSLNSLELISHRFLPETEGRGIELSFSDGIDPAMDLAGFIRVEPSVDFSAVRSGSVVKLLGSFQTGTDYTVNVVNGIKSQTGQELMDPVLISTKIPDIEPNIEFASDGYILPTSNQYRIRFKSVNVRKVYVTVKRIFENNLVQFLQSETLDAASDRNDDFDSWNLERVGVTVAQKEFVLGETPNQWLYHDIDMASLYKAGPTDILIFNITFQKEDMIWDLEDNSSSHYYNDDYYSNPNSYGYFYTHGSIVKPLLVSDIGLTVKQTGGGAVVYATDLLSANPLAGVKIKAFSYQNQVLAEATTDKNGTANLSYSKESAYAFIGEKNSQRSVVQLDKSAWNISTFKTEGAVVESAGVRCFAYTERGVYRPGDPVYLSAIFRNQNDSFPDNHPVSVKLFDPRGQFVTEQSTKTGKDGFYSFKIDTEESWLTGTWTAELKSSDKTYTLPVKIEEFVPQRIKVFVNDMKYAPAARVVNGIVKSEYMFGSPAAGLAVKINGKLTPTPKTFEGFSSYNFSSPLKKGYETTEELANTTLDASGEKAFSWKIKDLKYLPSAATLEVYADVSEKGGRAVRNMSTLVVDPYDYYVGVQQPKLDWGVAKTNETYKVPVVLLSADGRPTAGRNLKYVLYRNDNYWWYQYDDNDNFLQKYKTDSHTVIVESKSFTSNSSVFTVDMKAKDWGQHYFEVIDEAGGHAGGFFFYSSPWWGSASNNSGTADVLMLEADRANYEVGDKAKIRIPLPEKGMVLVTIEKRDQILSQFWVKEGKPGVSTYDLEIPVTQEMVPNAFVSVSVIQAHDQTANDRPIRLYGVSPLLVSMKGTKSELQIICADTVKPKGQVNVKVKNTSGKKTQITVAVVDEGLLDVTNFKTPDPWGYFYQKEKLLVKTSDIYSQVISAVKGPALNVFSVGGGDMSEMSRPDDANKQKRFPSIVFFQGPVYTNDKGEADFSFTLPEYMGRVKIMAVSAEGMSYGSAEKSVFVKDDLLLLTSMPRQVGPQDEFDVQVTVFNTRKDVFEATVKCTLTGPVSVVGASETTLKFKGEGEADAVFRIKVKNSLEAANIKISAQTKFNSTEANTYLPLKEQNPRLTITTVASVAPGQSANFDVPATGLTGGEESTISISRLAPLNLKGRLDYLIHYPYGCIEQTTSSVLPQLYLSNVNSWAKSKASEIDANIKAGIERLLLFQTSSGGLSYWPGEKEASYWGTNYASHFLIEAKKKGYAVVDDFFMKLMSFQKASAISGQGQNIERAYRVYLLALAGFPEQGEMNILLNKKWAEMTNPEKLLLCAAYYLSGRKDIAKEYMSKTSLTVDSYKQTGDSYGSTTRDRALMLSLLVDMQQSDKIFDIFQEVAKNLSSEYWYSTQETGFMILSAGKAINAYYNTEKIETKGYVLFPDGTKQGFSFLEPEYSMAFSGYTGKRISVFLENAQKATKVFVVHSWNGVPAEPVVRKSANNLDLKVDFFLDDPKWGASSGFQPYYQQPGVTFWARVELTKTTAVDAKELFVQYKLPNGWEIENTRLSGELPPTTLVVKGATDRYEYMDLRDDMIVWFFDMDKYDSKRYFTFKVRTVTPGNYYHPPVIAGAMYDNTWEAILPVFNASVDKTHPRPNAGGK